MIVESFHRMLETKKVSFRLFRPIAHSFRAESAILRLFMFEPASEQRHISSQRMLNRPGQFEISRSKGPRGDDAIRGITISRPTEPILWRILEDG